MSLALAILIISVLVSSVINSLLTFLPVVLFVSALAYLLRPAIDVGALQILLGSMRRDHLYLGHTADHMRGQDGQILDLGPTLDSVEEQIAALRQQINDHDAAQKAGFERIKADIKARYKDEIVQAAAQPPAPGHTPSTPAPVPHAAAPDSMLMAQIRAEVKKQVAEQLGQQLVPAHLPRTLHEHEQDGAAQIAALRAGVANSKARRANADITDQQMSTAFAPVLKPDGTESGLWPRDLNTLFAYTETQAHALVADFGLHDHADRTRNVNRFLRHIGVGVSLVS
ncbi:hypothetical protein BD413DRAFT_614237 [Trametes elegans]|nr:hypothetical protein BD413DRAFT_614237 [Trametes elegans]